MLSEYVFLKKSTSCPNIEEKVFLSIRNNFKSFYIFNNKKDIPNFNTASEIGSE
jgi:hypothetical protein